jgi:hypothetical protein
MGRAVNTTSPLSFCLARRTALIAVAGAMLHCSDNEPGRTLSPDGGAASTAVDAPGTGGGSIDASGMQAPGAPEPDAGATQIPPAPAPSGAAAFIGTWKFMGSRTFACGGDPAMPQPNSGMVQIRAGTDSALVVVRQCDVKHEVNGNVATVVPNQTCRYMTAGSNVTVNYMTSTLTLTDAGSMTWQEVWSGTLANATSSTNCMQTLEATLSR